MYTHINETIQVFIRIYASINIHTPPKPPMHAYLYTGTYKHVKKEEDNNADKYSFFYQKEKSNLKC